MPTKSEPAYPPIDNSSETKQAISDNSPLLGGFWLCCNPKEYLLSAERFWRSLLSLGAIVRPPLST